MKKTVLLSIVMVLALSMAISGSIAYLSDTDSDVNVMTLGNVQIEQIEQERVDESKLPTEEGNLKEYGQGRPLYPAYHEGTSIPYNAASTANQAWKVVESGRGALDKFVTVKNIGASDAYVRTWFAFESEPADANGTVNRDLVHAVINNTGNVPGSWEWKWLEGTTEIDDSHYQIGVATYVKALPAGETTVPSLKQVYMENIADNDYVALFDNTYEILVFSQAVQTINMPEDPTEALNAAFGSNYPWKDGDVENNMPIIINSEEEFQDKLTTLTSAGAGSNTIHLAKDLDFSNIEWMPIKVDGYNGADIITVEGNGHVIKGMTSPLFAGGFAGRSGIVIKNLTIADSNIVSTNEIGSGAFIDSVDSMQKIVLQNCHLKDSTVTGGPGSRTGGLIGWTAGYNNVNDGPVKTYVTIEDCSVIGSTITCDGSVGGIYGHAGNNAWTYSTVKNCTVKDCTLNSTDDGGWRVGVVVGTANVGEMTIAGITESGNTLTQTGKTAPAGQSSLYGRFVPGATGKLVIDGTEITLN